MKIQIFGILLLLGLTMAQEAALKVSSANSDFTRSLYKILSKEDGNVFFSPLSIHTILSLVSQGAGTKTLSALESSLNIESGVAKEGYKNVMSDLNNVSNVTLHIANKVFVKNNYKLKETFQTVAVQNYFAEVEGIEFAAPTAAKQINDWVEKKTNNKIHDLIKQDALTPLTRMVLVNAIYFKGDWLHQFPKSNTEKQPFYTSETDSIQVDMMYQKDNFRYGENEELDAQILEMQYKNKDVSMVIILPKKRTGIKDLEAKLENFDLSKLRENMYFNDVKVWLPKFKIETEMNLNEPLKKLGLASIFDDADFSGLLDNPEALAVSEVIQKAFIEVNEEGAEAAAATGSIFYMRSGRFNLEEPKEFRADHPLLFSIIIKNNEGGRPTILFSSKLASL